MNDEAATRLFAVLMLHERKEDINGIYCSECGQIAPCRTVRIATMDDADEVGHRSQHEQRTRT